MFVPGANTVKESGSIAGSIRGALNTVDRPVQSIWEERMTSEMTGAPGALSRSFRKHAHGHWDHRNYFVLSQQEQLEAPQQTRARSQPDQSSHFPSMFLSNKARRDLGTLCLDGDFPRSGHSVDLNFTELALLSFLLAKCLTSSHRIRLYSLVWRLFRTRLELKLKYLSPWSLHVDIPNRH